MAEATIFPFVLTAMVSVATSLPRWAWMWLTAAAIYFACKVLTWRAATTSNVRAWRQWAYLLAWPGMNAADFFTADKERRPQRAGLIEWSTAIFNVLVGCAIFWNAHRLLASSSAMLLGWAGMVGIVLTLHFGLFHLLSCLWRNFGFDAPPLMNEPVRSRSVAEFWGRGWNIAFRDLIYQFVFRPLRKHCGAPGALVVGFILSGLVHELVISVPAGGGYGGPMCFFSIQSAAVLFERSSYGQSLHLGHEWGGWLFTGLVLLLPVRLLFHDPFVTNIVVPFMKALGAA